MGWNTPDDWGGYYTRCPLCGTRYHASEGGCRCLEDHEQCNACLKRDNRSDRPGGYHHISTLKLYGTIYFCKEHLTCLCCDRAEKEIQIHPDEGDLVCSKCWNQDHNCPKDYTVLDQINEAVWG